MMKHNKCIGIYMETPSHVISVFYSMPQLDPVTGAMITFCDYLKLARLYYSLSVVKTAGVYRLGYKTHSIQFSAASKTP